jgi:hypothetical protein
MLTSLYPRQAVYAEQKSLPTWATKAKQPDDKNYTYAVGVSSNAEKIEDGMANSWANGLESFARTRFPHLQSIVQFSKETLTGSSFERLSSLKLDDINWEGISEAIEQGSPHVTEQISPDGKSTFTVYRLLRWDANALKKEIQRQSAHASSDMVRSSKDLASGSSQLKVVTKPENAHVILDDELIGKSNIEIKGLKPGKHKVRIQLDNFEIINEEIDIKDNGKSSLDYKLKRKQGKIEFKSEPPGALVFVNKFPVGRTPVSTTSDLGVLSVDLQLDGFASVAREITHLSDETVHEEKLQPKPSKLTVITSPVSANLFLNDKSIGHSPIVGLTVLGGRHIVKAELEGYGTVEKEIDISGIKETTVVIQLVSVKTEEAAERAGYENLQLRRYLNAALDDEEKKKVLETGCARGFTDFCSSLVLDYASGKKKRDTELSRERWYTDSESAKSRINGIHQFWEKHCFDKELNSGCAKIESEIAALFFLRNAKLDGLNKTRILAKKQLISAFYAIDKMKMNVLTKCRTISQNSSKNLLCAYLSNIDGATFQSQLSRICDSSDKGGYCAVFISNSRKSIGSNASWEVKKIDESWFSSFKLPPTLEEERNKLLPEGAFKAGCANIGIYQLTADLEDFYTLRDCISKVKHEEQFVYLMNLCERKKNAIACDYVLDNLDKYKSDFGFEAAQEDMEKLVRLSCEYGEGTFACFEHRDRKEISESLKRELAEISCERGDAYRCDEIGDFQRAFDIKSKECEFLSKRQEKLGQLKTIGACQYATEIFRTKLEEKQLPANLASAACRGGVEEACFEGDRLTKENVKVVELRCGNPKIPKDEFWDPLGYCEEVASKLRSNDKDESKLLRKLVSIGCNSHQNFEMCILDGNKSKVLKSYRIYCQRKSNYSQSRCEEVSDTFPINDRVDLCLKGGFSGACASAGFYFLKQQNKKKSLFYFEKACNLGKLWNCGNAGGIHLDEKRFGDAIKFLKIGCDKKSPRWCFLLASAYSEIGMKGEAYKTYYENCFSREHAGSCLAVTIFEKSRDKRRDALIKMRDISTPKCNSGDNASCEDLANANRSMEALDEIERLGK